MAALAHEQDGYEGNELVVSAQAYDRGIQRLDQLINGVVAVDQLGSTLHYQFDQATRAKGGKTTGFTVRFAGSPAAAAQAITEGGGRYGDVCRWRKRAIMLATNQGKLVAWASQFSDSELGRGPSPQRRC